MNTHPISHVVNGIKVSAKCADAVMHYRTNENMSDQAIREQITQRGSANFDIPYNDEDTKYRVESYIHSYLAMHYDANRAVFSGCTFFVTEKMVFIDFGCGPITSGLALLATLGKASAGTEISYYGVDISRNMRDKADSINQEYKLFSDAVFYAGLESAITHSKTAIAECLTTNCVVIINFSYVLSACTLNKSESVDNLFAKIVLLSSIVFNNPHHSIYIIYQNPAVFVGEIYENWSSLRAQLTRKFKHEICNKGNVDYGLQNPVYHCVIHLLANKS